MAKLNDKLLDGNWDLSMPCSAPRGYRDGPFELDDEAKTAWKLSGFRQVFSGTIEAPRDQAAKAAAENLEELAQKLTEDQDQSESDEDRYTFDVDEKEDGLTFQADFSTAQAGGSYEKPVTRGNVTLCVVHQRMRVMRFHITVSHLLAAVADYPQVRFYIAGLGVPDEEKRQEILDKGLFPMLFTLNFTAPPSLYDLLGKKPEELFPAAVQSLNFTAGETVEAGEFAVTIPEGLHYTRTENPKTRIFTAIPREIPFDAEDFWAYSAVALTLQTGAPIVNIHAPLDTADGEKEVELILQSLSISDSSSAGQTAAGKTTRAARSPDHYICYELIDDNDVDMNFRYYVFTKSFLYAGQYVGKKAGLGPDCSKIHTGLLETYLQGFRYTGGGEKLLEDAGRRDLGRFAGDDGRLDAFMAVAFFTEDVIFFHPEDLLWDGKYHSFANYRFNAAVLPNAEGVLEHSEAILEGLRALIQELEENPDLRVPAEDLHPEMRRFLKGADFTPAVVFYMECFQFFRFWEEEPDKYQFRLEERLANSFYNEATNGDLQYPYFEKFIGALRAYNGNHKPYTASCGGTYGGQTGEHLPDIKVYKYELDEDGFLKEDENGDFVYRKKTPEELAWEARMAKKAVEAKLAKVPFDRVSSVTVSGSAFVLTGDFEKSPEDRDAVKRLIEAKGGRCTGSISGKTNYLVIGALGGFGERKIEQVQEQRAKGKDIKIIREADLMAALEGRTPPPPKPGPKPAPKPAPAKPAPKPAPAKPAPKPVPRSTPAKKSGEGSVRIEKIEPEEGEFLRMRVTVDIPGLTDDEPAPPPKPKKRAQVDENEKKQLRAQREEAEKKSEAACSEAVKKGEETRRQLDSRIDEIKRDLDAQEQRLQSLGIFKMGEKKLARQEIARLNQELSQAQQELSGFLQKLEKELVNIRGHYLKAVVEKVRKAAYGYLFDCKLPPKEETVVFSILKMLDETPKSRSELMDEFYYSFGSADSSRLLVGKAFMNPFVQNGKLQRITADGSVKTLSGYYF
ncbi:BRCT domain-containing protein [uncultured Oscillibacter sp.]|uniref:BRCT domain-containing protein n=1 Tax=uncultured Oscillibacter sp. TaxID=876091 RepID=UPI00260A1EFF|nr:BRCT domain-containing protein [uncultured Oscillibacter sp.]